MKEYRSAVTWLGAWWAFYNYALLHLSLGKPPLGFAELTELGNFLWLICEVMRIA